LTAPRQRAPRADTEEGDQARWGRRRAVALAGAALAAPLLLAACGSAGDPVPPLVRLADLRLMESSVFEQRFEIDLRIGNPNDFALPIDGLTFDGRRPNDYIDAFPIGLKSKQVVKGNKVLEG